MFYRTEELLGMSVQASDGKLGELHDLYLDDVHWVIRYLVVHTEKEMEERHLLISPHITEGVDLKTRTLAISCSREQAENSPPIDLREPVAVEQLDRLHQYYGWPAYWAEGALFGSPTGLYPVVMPTEEMVDRAEEEEPIEPGNAHLRSVSEVLGYYIHARDGEIGHVADFLVDADGWAIRYLLIDTRNWLPGRTVPVSPLWIRKISWAQKEVSVDLTREEIRSSPEYDPSQPIDRQFETRLFRHYTKQSYWKD